MAYGGKKKYMDAAAELGRNPVGKHQIRPEYGDEQADAGRGLPKPSRETKFSGTNVDRDILVFPIQLTTSRIGNLTRLIRNLAICVTIHLLVSWARPTGPSSPKARKRTPRGVYILPGALFNKTNRGTPVRLLRLWRVFANFSARGVCFGGGVYSVLYGIF